MAFQSARLTAIFGASPQTVTYEQLEALTENDAAGEAEDLDYKLRYDTGEKGSEDIAVDIATFANHLGGVLVVGMAEVNARPSKAAGIELTDEFKRRIRTCVASRVFPQPQFDVREVPDPTDTSKKPRGLLLIMVPRSPLAPHAVMDPTEKEKLRWPRRHGTGKVWLTESEIAASYRRRFVSAAEQGERLETVEAECLATVKAHRNELDPQVGGLLLVSLVPDEPGEMRIDQEQYAQFRLALASQRVFIGDEGNGELQAIGVGRRRLLGQTPGWMRMRAELHTDGSGVLAVHLPGRMSRNAPTWIFDMPIVLSTASALRFLARHARDRTGASAGAAVSASLRSYTRAPDEQPILGGSAVLAVSGPFQDVFGRETQKHARGEGSFLLDHLADGGPDLARSTETLVSDLFQSFNAVGIRQITPEGKLVLPAWGSERSTAEQWARTSGVPIAEM